MSGLEVIEKIVKILALGIGGAWVLWNINWRRERAPKLQMEHSFYSRDLHNGQRLVTVILTIRNSGGVLLRAQGCFTRLLQVFPLPFPDDVNAAIAEGDGPLDDGGTHFTWRLLDKRIFGTAADPVEVEPGESDSIACDFLVPDRVETVRVYSFIPNAWKAKQGIGWTHTTMHDIPKGESMSEKERVSDSATERQQRPTKEPEPAWPDRMIQRQPDKEPEPVKKA